MTEVYFDCETYSEVPLKGPKGVGGLLYSRHPSTRVLMWTFYMPEWDRPIAIEGEPDLWEAWRKCSTGNAPGLLVHWGAFDRFIAERFAKPGSPFAEPPHLRDDQPQAIHYADAALFDLRQHCLQCGGPAGLSNAAEWVGGLAKLDGASGLKRFTQPDSKGRRTLPTDDPAGWASFTDYGLRDAEAMASIARHLGPIGAPGLAAEGWRVVERMNARGFPIDVPSVKAARDKLEAMEPGLIAECERITGGLRPTQNQKLAKFWGLPNAQKPTLEAYVKRDDISRAQKRSAEIRLETSGATRHKLTPMLLRRDENDRVPYQFTYYGAWTRRLTAQGTQPQNFFGAKPEESYFKDLATGRGKRDWFGDTRKNIRGFIQAPKGRTLVSADFSQIELRVMAWQAGEEWLLDALRDGVDVYRITGGEIYGKKPEALTLDERYIAKRVELASQFGLSGTGKDNNGGLYARLKADGVKGFGRARSQNAIDVYQRTHPMIVDFWNQMQKGFKKCLAGSNQSVGVYCFEKTRDDLIRLIRPSGQFQCFWSPELRESEFGSTEISYLGRHPQSGKMVRVGTYGARLAQGVTQGTAADLLHSAMHTAEVNGYPPIMSIHDEIVTEIEDDGFDHVDLLCEIFVSNKPEWAKDIPIEAEGWQGRRFRK